MSRERSFADRRQPAGRFAAEWDCAWHAAYMDWEIDLGDLIDRINALGGDTDAHTFIKDAVATAVDEAEPAGVGLPGIDTSLPLFVYGNLKRGELGHDLIAKWVTACNEEVDGPPGVLWELDGIPMMTLRANGKRDKGQLLSFDGPDAYETVAKFEPASHYEWATENVGPEGAPANLLVAVSTLRPSDTGSGWVSGPWSTAFDPLFRDGLPVIAEVIRAEGLHPLVGAHGDWARFYRLQSAYMLACSVLERIALRVIEGKSRRPTWAITELGRTVPFMDAVYEAGLSNMDRKVSRADLPARKKAVPLSKPEHFAKWAYQIRSNIVHQGKSADHEAELVRTALLDLHDTLRVYLLNRVPEFHAQWALTDPVGEKNAWRVKPLLGDYEARGWPS